MFILIEYNRKKHLPIPGAKDSMAETPPHHARAIGEKLRTIRQEHQMSLRELSDRAEISASMLSQIETGKVFPSVRSLYSIAAALHVSIDYFFPEQNNNDSSSEDLPGNAASALTASEMRDAKVRGATESVQEFPATAQTSPIVHADTRPTIELMGGVSWSRLTARPEEEAEFLEINYAPGAMSGANMSHHEGREFGLILEGELVIELGFESYTLKTGDSIILDSTIPHRLVNKGSQPMRAVWVVLSQR